MEKHTKDYQNNHSNQFSFNDLSDSNELSSYDELSNSNTLSVVDNVSSFDNMSSYDNVSAADNVSAVANDQKSQDVLCSYDKVARSDVSKTSSFEEIGISQSSMSLVDVSKKNSNPDDSCSIISTQNDNDSNPDDSFSIISNTYPKR